MARCRLFALDDQLGCCVRRMFANAAAGKFQIAESGNAAAADL
jgi:hypothetical protein